MGKLRFLPSGKDGGDVRPDEKHTSAPFGHETGATSPSQLTLRRLGIDTYQEHIVYMRADCHVCQSEGFEARSRVQLTANGKSLLATLNVIRASPRLPSSQELPNPQRQASTFTSVSATASKGVSRSSRCILSPGASWSTRSITWPLSARFLASRRSHEGICCRDATKRKEVSRYSARREVALLAMQISRPSWTIAYKVRPGGAESTHSVA